MFVGLPLAALVLVLIFVGIPQLIKVLDARGRRLELLKDRKPIRCLTAREPTSAHRGRYRAKAKNSSGKSNDGAPNSRGMKQVGTSSWMNRVGQQVLVHEFSIHGWVGGYRRASDNVATLRVIPQVKLPNAYDVLFHAVLSILLSLALGWTGWSTYCGIRGYRARIQRLAGM